MHTNIARELLKEVKERSLNLYWELEAELVANQAEEEKGSVLALLKQESGSHEDKLRLLITYFWHAEEVSADALLLLRAASVLLRLAVLLKAGRVIDTHSWVFHAGGECFRPRRSFRHCSGPLCLQATNVEVYQL